MSRAILARDGLRAAAGPIRAADTVSGEMFRPVGSQPPSVYWRRRLVLLASVVGLLVLIVLTVNVVTSSDNKTPAAAGATSGISHSAPPSPTPSSTASTPPSSSSTSRSAVQSGHSHLKSSSSVPPAPCQVAKLGLAASSGKSQYGMTDQPVLSILVTNTGRQPCVQDLADPQIVLTVYNGESRVWGSHDCKVEPGTDPRTLMPKSTVRVSIVWSGLSSQPKCAGQRQRVGAGTYTLYASLAGRQARAAQFTIS